MFRTKVDPRKPGAWMRGRRLSKWNSEKGEMPGGEKDLRWRGEDKNIVYSGCVGHSQGHGTF